MVSLPVIMLPGRTIPTLEGVTLHRLGLIVNGSQMPFG
jgi:hypothetical protein